MLQIGLRVYIKYIFKPTKSVITLLCCYTKYIKYKVTQVCFL